MSIIKFNPFTGNFDLDSSRGGAQDTAQLVYEFKCQATTQVGDLVQHSTIDDETVDPVTNNAAAVPAIGIVNEKTSITTCKVLLFGIFTNGTFPGLQVGKKVYVGTDGKPTPTKPSTDYIQVIGEAITNSVLFLKPDMNRVKQS